MSISSSIDSSVKKNTAQGKMYRGISKCQTTPIELDKHKAIGGMKVVYSNLLSFSLLERDGGKFCRQFRTDIAKVELLCCRRGVE